MSHKAIIMVPFLTGYFVMRIIALIVYFGYDGINHMDGSDYLYITIASVVVGMIFVFAYLLMKYFEVI